MHASMPVAPDRAARRPCDASAPIREWLSASLLSIALLAGCAGPRGIAADRDGPEANPPPDLIRVPDAEPRIEPIRSGGPNKPYEALGQRYVPITQDTPFTERGLASWYGRKFQGRRTSSGELYNMYAMTAAHPTLPIPSYARVRNPANGREIVVRINDRGPFHSSRIVDLSYTAALKLDVLRGVAPVELSRITFDEIRSGAGQRRGTAPALELARSLPAPTPGGDALREMAADMPPSETSAGLPAAVGAPVASVSPTGAAALVDPPAGVADATAARAFTGPARGFWVQLGAYRQRAGAEAFQQRVVAEIETLGPMLAVFGDDPWFKLQAGPYPSRNDARIAAEWIRERLQLVPVIVQRR